MAVAMAEEERRAAQNHASQAQSDEDMPRELQQQEIQRQKAAISKFKLQQEKALAKFEAAKGHELEEDEKRLELELNGGAPEGALSDEEVAERLQRELNRQEKEKAMAGKTADEILAEKMQDEFDNQARKGQRRSLAAMEVQNRMKQAQMQAGMTRSASSRLPNTKSKDEIVPSEEGSGISISTRGHQKLAKVDTRTGTTDDDDETSTDPVTKDKKCVIC